MFAFGANQAGQLGVGAHVGTATDEPTLVPALAFMRVTSIAAGKRHSAAITGHTGALYMWGANGRSVSSPHRNAASRSYAYVLCRGQLGLGQSLLSADEPARVMHFLNQRAVQVVCGGEHTAAIVEDDGPDGTIIRSAYVWGRYA